MHFQTKHLGVNNHGNILNKTITEKSGVIRLFIGKR